MTWWWAILGAGVGCYLLKLAGLSVPAAGARAAAGRADRRPDPGRPAVGAGRRAGVRDGTHLTIDARAAGLAAAVVALLLRAPFLVVVVVAAPSPPRCCGWSFPGWWRAVDCGNHAGRIDLPSALPGRAPRPCAPGSAEVEEVLEADGEAGAVGDRADGQSGRPGVNDARSSESCRIVRVSPGPPRTTSWWATRPRSADGVHADAVDVGAAGARRARWRSRRASARSRPRGGRRRSAPPYAARCRTARRPCRGGAARRSRPTRRTARPPRRSASSGSRRSRSWARPARRRPGASASQPLERRRAGPRRSRSCRRRRGCRGRCRTRRLSITTSGWVKSTTASAPAATRSARSSPASTAATSSRSSAASTARQTSDADLAARAEHAHRTWPIVPTVLTRHAPTYAGRSARAGG